MPDVATINLLGRLGDGHWLDYETIEYQNNKPLWEYTTAHYQGTINHPVSVKNYLVRRANGETNMAYNERCLLADYSNHMAAVLDSIAGMLFAVEGDANRVYNDGQRIIMGDPNDASSKIGKLLADANGNGEGLQSILKQVAVDVMLHNLVWVLVDASGPFVQYLPAMSVTNWIVGKDPVVVVREEVDARNSITEEVGTETRYVVFYTDGWIRYRKGQSGVEVVDQGQYRFIDRFGRPALPIFPVRLPLRRLIGWQLAKKANNIFNMESSRDHILRVANFPKLNLVANDTLYEKILSKLEEGSNILQNNPEHTQGRSSAHHYIAPGPESAQVASEVLKRKVEEFYIAAFRMYGDSAKEKTATEARQDVSAGVGAFLQLLKTAIDSCENEILWRLEQALYPNDKTRWFKCKVERSDNFLPADVDRAIEQLRSRYFGEGKTVPIGKAAQLHAAKTIAEWDGLQYTESEIEEALEQRDLQIIVEKIGAAKMVIPNEVLLPILKNLLEEVGIEVDVETILAALNKQREAAMKSKAKSGQSSGGMGESGGDMMSRQSGVMK